jgi:hypothetical protein
VVKNLCFFLLHRIEIIILGEMVYQGREQKSELSHGKIPSLESFLCLASTEHEEIINLITLFVVSLVFSF